MNEELTDLEKKLLFMMENGGRWDGLGYCLTTGLPCLIIIVLGLHFQSWIAVGAGVVTYAGIRLRVVWQQDAMSPHISSAIKKLKRSGQPDMDQNSSKPAD